MTELCKRKIGKELFNISTFQKLSSYRIDDFIFERLEESMVSAIHVWENVRIELELDKDYQKLSGLTNASRARELFYPKSRDLTAVNENSPRLAGFLKHVDDHAYHSLYDYLLTSEGFSLPFANPTEALKSMNSHGKTMQLVMTHVVMWLNDEPAKINHREGNKPPLVDDLIPNASEVVPTSGSTVPEARSARVRDGTRDVTRSLPGHAEKSVARVKALDLQRDVLTYVEEHAATFTDAANKEYLNLMPDDDMEPVDYCERFRAGPWRDVLVRVQRAVGPGFKNACVVKFNTAAPDDLPSPPRVSLADSLQRVVVQHPEVAHNRALNNPDAIQALRGMMDEVVARWAADQNEKAILDRGPRRSMLAEAVAESEFAQWRSASLPSASRVVSDGHSKATPRTARDISPAEDRRSAVERRRGEFPWNWSPAYRRSMLAKSPADAAGVSARRPTSSVPAKSPPLAKSPRRRSEEGESVHEDDGNPQTLASSQSSEPARLSNKTDRPTQTDGVNQSGASASRRQGRPRSMAVQGNQQKGGWRTKPMARA